MDGRHDVWTHLEPQGNISSQKLNWLRAAVLGANDGIVSTASLVVGVAAAGEPARVVLTAGVAGLLAGALSMGVGEYISVSTQRDSERALIEKEKQELIDQPDFELKELTYLYLKKGLSEETAYKVAKELSDHDVLAAHLDAELGIDPNDLTNPWHAAYASAASFSAGAITPILMITLPPAWLRIPVTFAGVFLALALTGTLSAHAGGAGKLRAGVRVVTGGLLAMAVTYGIGWLFGVAGI